MRSFSLGRSLAFVFASLAAAVLTVGAASASPNFRNSNIVDPDLHYCVLLDRADIAPLFDLAIFQVSLRDVAVATFAYEQPDDMTFAKINRTSLAPSDAWAVRTGNDVWRHAITSYG